MTKSRSNLITLILAIAGAAIALLLTVEHFTKMDIGCSKTGAGCTTTLNSQFGHVGQIPTAMFGLGMYLTFVGLCLLRGRMLAAARQREKAQANAYATSAISLDATDENGNENSVSGDDAVVSLQPISATSTALGRETSVKQLDAVLWGLAALGFGISIWLQYVAIYQLRSFCPYCFTSACLVTGIFAITSWDYLVDGRKLSGEQKMLGAVVGFILVLCSFIVFPDVMQVIAEGNRHKIPPVEISKQSDRDIVLNQVLNVKGNPDAKYTLVEFADYMCQHCAKASPIVDDILKRYPKDFKLVFRNYPLPIATHKWSRAAACAAEAAGEQGKFWEMHNVIFAHQEEMTKPEFKEETLDTWANDLKMNVAKFQKDRQSPEIKQRVMLDNHAAEGSNVASTPTIFFVAPTFMVKFAGTDDLLKYVADPSKWNAPPPVTKQNDNSSKQ